MDIAISVRNLSKSYRLYNSPSERMKELLHPFKKTYHREFWALNDVSFDVRRGESLGIIGKNGSGKSTLLQLICGILPPTTGEARVNGRISALLELGAGFNREFTGRENVYMNGALMGFAKKEMDKRVDTIADFADIGDFIEQPVKIYSSGMFMRLAFAAAINMDPDILIIDEILSVGDRNFQLKCYQKLHELKEKGITFILVAHSEYAIREQTQKCVYLKNGRLEFLGPSEEGISLYIKESLKEKSNNIPSDDGKKEIMKDNFRTKLKFYDQDWKEITYIESGKLLNLVIEGNLKDSAEPILSVNFYSDNGFMYCVNSQYENVDLKRASRQNSRIIISIPQFHLPVNNYSCSLTISDGTNANIIEWQEKKYNLIVVRPMNARGSLKLPNSWKIE